MNRKYQYTNELYSERLLNKHKDKIFVFGDNFQRHGTGGQAIIRHCPNTFGIPTKKAPTYNPTDFIYDIDPFIQHIQALILNRFLELDKLAKDNIIVFPSGGLGTGLAKLHINAPITLQLIDDMVSARLGFDYTKLRK